MSIAFPDLNHSLRIPLAAEVHSRPFLRLDPPEAISHLAIYGHNDLNAGTPNVAVQHAFLASLCAHFGVAAPAVGSKHFYHDFGRFRLKWESHTEFATYTFTKRVEQNLPLTEAFARAPLYDIPQQWLLELKGKVMVAAHVVITKSDASAEDSMQDLQQVFEKNKLLGSYVSHRSELWTDFLIQPDGFSRFVIRDLGLRALQAGRLVQRVLEIETYRMMALLALPHAQRTGPILNAIESELATLTAAMVETDNSNATKKAAQDADGDQALLDQITRLAARIEKLSLDNNYRFSASQAYFRLIHARIEEMRETRMEGFQTVEEFMDRRLTPAMNTCQAMANRQDALGRRIANSNDLLRTRVGIMQERQNRQILQSMNARAAQQLRLQQAVEGLSVAAITYYVIGLFSYAGKAAKGFGLIDNPDMGTGLLVPVVAAAVWLGLRRLHKKVHKRSQPIDTALHPKQEALPKA